MADVQPLRGIRYASDMIGNLAQIITPPFDVISEEAQARYYTRTSLLARIRLEPWSARVVLPHETTHRKAKNDRLKLTRACAANFSPLMSIYDDPQGRMRRLLGSYAQHVEVNITDEVGEGHRLQPITDAKQSAVIQDFFAERQLYIADGHHRYETALNYREEVREQRRKL